MEKESVPDIVQENEKQDSSVNVNIYTPPKDDSPPGHKIPDLPHSNHKLTIIFLVILAILITAVIGMAYLEERLVDLFIKRPDISPAPALIQNPTITTIPIPTPADEGVISEGEKSLFIN